MLRAGVGAADRGVVWKGERQAPASGIQSWDFQASISLKNLNVTNIHAVSFAVKREKKRALSADANGGKDRLC